MCTINDGEGTVKKIYTYFCYSLMPYVILTPVIFGLSHVVTFNEQFLISLTYIVMLTWVLVLGVLSLKEVNNYTGIYINNFDKKTLEKDFVNDTSIYNYDLEPINNDISLST